MSTVFTIDPVPQVLFGAGAVDQLPQALGEFSGHRCLLVTDPGVVAAGVAATVEQACRAADLAVVVFDQISPSPTLADIEQGRNLAVRGDAALVVAVGGGSALDAGKAIALGATNPAPVRQLDDPEVVVNPALPLIAVPTTAGTGAETNGFGVFTDTEEMKKVYIGDQSSLPRLAVLDPLLTLGVPGPVTAATGMDALTHALESLISRRSNPMAASYDLRAIELVAGNLIRAVTDGRDRQARSNLLLAAHLAGRGMGSTGLGVAHAIGHALSNRLGTPHGLALAMVLPSVLRFNLEARTDAMAEAASAFGAATNSRPGPGSEESQAQMLVQQVSTLSHMVGTDAPLHQAGVTNDLVPVLAADAVADAVIANNPRTATQDDVAEVIAAAC